MSVHLSASQAARLGIKGTGKAPHRPRGLTARFDWADVLHAQIVALRLPVPVREHIFHPPRKWRMDLAWIDRRLYVECDGGEFVKGSIGRHGTARDCDKANAAVLLGWRPLRFVGSQIRNGSAVKTLEQVLR